MTSALADRWTLYDRLIQDLRYRKVIHLIPKGSILLDCGCGDGEFLNYVGRRISKGYGVDNLIKNLRPGGNYTFIEGNLNERIPLDNDVTDIVTALAVLEHLDDPDAFVKEVFRILKPGGAFILTTPSPRAKPVLELLAYRLKIISGKDIKDHKKYFNSDELINLLSKFTDVTIGYFLFGLNTVITAKKT